MAVADTRGWRGLLLRLMVGVLIASAVPGVAGGQEAGDEDLLGIVLDRTEVDVADGVGVVEVQVRTRAPSSADGPRPGVWFRGPQGSGPSASDFEVVEEGASEVLWRTSVAFGACGDDGVHMLEVRVGTTRYPAEELAAREMPDRVTVSGAYADDTPPEVVGIELSPDPFASGDEPGTIAVRVDVVDPTPCGVNRAGIELRSPSGEVRGNILDPDRGPDHGRWVGRVDMPAFAEAGRWTITVGVADRAGNVRILSGEDLVARGLPEDLEVQSPYGADSAGPQLVDLQVTPLRLDTSAGPGSFQVTAAIVDDVVGHAYGWAVFCSREHCERSVWLLADGSGLSTTISSDVVVAADDTGVWELRRLVLLDGRGNERVIEGEALRAAGFPQRVAVSNAVFAGDAPPPPSGFEAVVSGPRAELTWESVTGTDGAVGPSVVVHRDGAAIAVVPSDDGGFVDHLELGETATYHLATADRYTVGPGTPERTVRRPGPPSPPGDLSAAPGGAVGTIDLTWSDSEDDGGLPLTGYRISRDGLVVADVPASASSWTDTGRTPLTAATYTIAALNAIGASGPSGSVCTVPGPWLADLPAPGC